MQIWVAPNRLSGVLCGRRSGMARSKMVSDFTKEAYVGSGVMRWTDVRAQRSQRASIELQLAEIAAEVEAAMRFRPLPSKTRRILWALTLFVSLGLVGSLIANAYTTRFNSRLAADAQDSTLLQQQSTEAELDAMSFGILDTQSEEALIASALAGCHTCLANAAKTASSSGDQAAKATQHTITVNRQATEAFDRYEADTNNDLIPNLQFWSVLGASVFSILLGGFASFGIIRLVESRRRL